MTTPTPSEPPPPPPPRRHLPAGTDYTLQSGDVWFWEPAPQDGGTQALRTLDELIFTYHSTVGHNTVMELDFAIDRHGEVEASHAALYKRFGDFIDVCYGDRNVLAQSVAVVADPAAVDAATGGRAVLVAGPAVAGARVGLRAPEVFDRVVLVEDQTAGQRVRGWAVEWSADSGKTWTLFAAGR